MAARRRALSNSWRMLRSLWPTYMSITSANDTVRNCAPSSPATARAMNVLPQPGGPYSSSPPRRLILYRRRSSGLRSGARNAASSRALTSVIPATSARARAGRSASPGLRHGAGPGRAVADEHRRQAVPELRLGLSPVEPAVRRPARLGPDCSAPSRSGASRSGAGRSGAGRSGAGRSGAGAPPPEARTSRASAAALPGSACTIAPRWRMASSRWPASSSRPARCNRSPASSGMASTARRRLARTAGSGSTGASFTGFRPD